jgi:hypothetical protein
MPEPVGLAGIGLAECLRLLGSQVVGRVIFTDAAMPTALPVTFVLDEGEIVFRAGEGSVLATATRRAVVAFEADELDPATHAGWTVLGVGSTSEVTDPARLAGFVGSTLPAWAPAGSALTIALHIQHLSGRWLRPSSDSVPVDHPAMVAGEADCVRTGPFRHSAVGLEPSSRSAGRGVSQPRSQSQCR